MRPPSPLRLAALLALLLLPAAPARAETGWLEWVNRGIFGFNAEVAAGVAGIAEALPQIPAPVRAGLGNLANTVISEPLNALAHLVAGREEDALVALRRSGVNLTRGWLGTVDRARQEGLVTNPIDFGLALCVRGVPPGPFIVLPLAGIRTLRDGLSDWVMAHVVLYGAVFGVLQVPFSLQNLVVLEAAEEVVTLAIAGELGEMPAAARVPDYQAARALYLAGREQRCAELAARH
jgi:phospholipid-binding lipoprotein MlaA